MRRPHLFEFGDQPWLPQVVRDAETGYMVVAYGLLPLARLWAEKILTVLSPGQPVEILDLCSGSGGPMPRIIGELEARGHAARARLTDLYPHLTVAADPNIRWQADPVDATRVPATLGGVRTMFSAFHHFRPETAKAILKDAFDHRRTICIFESGSGTWLGVVSMLLVPGAVLALMPWVRPFRWTYLVFTYLFPLIPLMILWDGIVSMLRVYSPEQMMELTHDLRAPDYSWEIGRIRLRGVPDGLPYLIGQPLR